jgi:transcriptional regulator with XRE-family HTH domain
MRGLGYSYAQEKKEVLMARMVRLSPIRLKRLYEGLTQVQVAAKVRMGQWRLSQIERGMPPTDEEAAALAKFFQVDAAELFGERQVRTEASYR